MAKQKAKRQVSPEKAIKQINAIYQEFLNKIDKIEKVRDQKIADIIKKAEARQIEKIRQELR